MEVVNKKKVKTVFTVELDEDEVGFIAVALGGAMAKYYSDNTGYFDKEVPKYTNEMASHLYGTFKKMFEGEKW